MSEKTKALFTRLSPERQDEIIRGIIEALSIGGIQGTNVRKVATHLGITHGSLFHYFPSKNAMVHAIIERGIEYQREAFASIPEGPAEQPGIDQIRILLDFAWDFCITRSNLIALWYELSLPSAAEYARQIFSLEEESIQRLKKIISFMTLKPDADPDAAVYLIDNAVGGILKHSLSEVEERKFAAHFGNRDKESVISSIIATVSLLFE